MTADDSQHLIKSTTRTYQNEPVPPLVSFSITNPLTYLKAWWKKVMTGEGIDIKFKIHPVTAITCAAILALGGFGLGRLTIPVPAPLVQYLPQLAPSPTPSPWQDTAFTGILRYLPTTKKYSLETSSAPALILDIPATINLSTYVGKRLLVYGSYNSLTHVLKVQDSSVLELLPLKPSPIPTLVPSPTSSVFPTPQAYL